MSDNKTVTFDASTQRVVPLNPTDEMLNAGWDALGWSESGENDGRHPRDVFHAMLAAAPTPAAQSVEPHGFTNCVFEDAPPTGYKSWNDWMSTPLRTGATIRASTSADWRAAQSAGQEAVYQTQRIMGGWDDVTQAEFARTHESRRRIVYTAPATVSTNNDAGSSELSNVEDAAPVNGFNAELLAALEDVVRIADRKTVEFDHARASISKARTMMQSVPVNTSETVPLGAIENGRVLADRLETFHEFASNTGDLRTCSDWQEFRRCFEHLAQWAMHDAAPVNGGEREQHEWNAEGERCVKCGDKDWMNTECSGERAADAQQVGGDMTTREFHGLCRLLPPGVSWGENLTPAIVRSIVAGVTSPAKVGGDEREAFETAYHAVFPARPLLIPGVLSRDGDDYQHPNVDGCWKLWRKAGAARARMPDALIGWKFIPRPDDVFLVQAPDGDEWATFKGAPGYELVELLARDALSADGGEDKRDAERLDFMIEQQAWVQWTVRDDSIRQCQVYTQDEDENYHILSGEARFFSTPREAIDAAIAANQSGKGGEQ